MTGFAGVVRFVAPLDERERALFGSRLDERASIRAGSDVLATNERGTRSLLFLGRVHDESASGGEATLDAAGLLERFEREDRAFVERLRGFFAIAIVDHERREVILLRDHVGHTPLYWTRIDDGIVFATRLSELFRHPDVERAHDLVQLAWFFQGFSHWQEGVTVWKGIRRVPARGRIVAGKGSVDEGRWLDWGRFQEGSARSPEAWVEGFRDVFARAVRRSFSPGERVASLLSGGLDSSSVATVLAGQLEGLGEAPLVTYSARFGRTAASDEGEFIHAVARDPGIDSKELVVDDLGPFDPVVLEHIARRDEPCYGANLYVNLALAREAGRGGAQVLFDGVDGDSVMGYGFERLLGLALRGRWFTLRRELALAAPRVGLTPKRLFQTEVTAPLKGRAAGLIGDRLRHRWRRLRGRGFGARDLREDFLESPEARASLENLRFPSADLTSRQAIRSGLESSFNQSILELLGGAASEAGLRTAYPFFDLDLVGFSLSLPDDVRLRDGWTRWIQREAGQRLPDEVRWRKWKNLLSRSFSEALAAHHGDLMRALRDPALPPYRFVNQKRVLEIQSRFEAHLGASDAFFIGKLLALACWMDPDSVVLSVRGDTG